MISCNKKGAERTYLILSIIAVITIILIVVLVKTFSDSYNFDKDACHESVIYRGSLNEAMDNQLEFGKAFTQSVTGQIDLKCKTQEKIITSTDADKIKKEIADEMASCWIMMGEGKTNFFGRGWTEESRCVICSKITFSKKVEDYYYNKDISPIADFNDYITKTRLPGQEDITYADLMAGADKHFKQVTIASDPMPTDSNSGSNIETALIDPGSGRSYVIVYELWQTDKLYEVLAGVGAVGAVMEGRAIAKKRILGLKSLGATQAEVVAGVWNRPVRDVTGKKIVLKLSDLDAPMTQWKLESGGRVQLINLEEAKLKTFTKNTYFPTNMMVKDPTTGNMVPRYTDMSGRSLKVRPIATFGGSILAGGLSAAVDKATGTITLLFAYWAASSAVDSLRNQKYNGFIRIEEYSAEDINELGCTNLDVVP